MSKTFVAGCSLLFGALGVLLALFFASEVSTMVDPRASALLAAALLGLVLMCIALACHGARVHKRFVRMHAAKKTQAEKRMSVVEHFCGILLSASIISIMVVIAVSGLINFFSPVLGEPTLPQQVVVGIIYYLLLPVLGIFFSLVLIGAWNIFAAARRQLRKIYKHLSS